MNRLSEMIAEQEVTSAIDNIVMEQVVSELNVCAALCDVYAKREQIASYSNCPVVEYAIFTEADGSAADDDKKSDEKKDNIFKRAVDAIIKAFKWLCNAIRRLFKGRNYEELIAYVEKQPDDTTWLAPDGFTTDYVAIIEDIIGTATRINNCLNQTNSFPEPQNELSVIHKNVADIKDTVKNIETKYPADGIRFGKQPIIDMLEKVIKLTKSSDLKSFGKNMPENALMNDKLRADALKTAQKDLAELISLFNKADAKLTTFCQNIIKKGKNKNPKSMSDDGYDHSNDNN